MKNPLRRVIAVAATALLAASALVAGAGSASAGAPWNCTTSATKGECGPYTYPAINGETSGPWVDQNMWGPISGETQTTSANSPGDWQTVNSTPAGNTSVTTYPNAWASYSEPQLSSFPQVTSSFSESMPHNTGTRAWAAFDNWFNNWANEEMIQYDFSKTADRCSASQYVASAQFGGSNGVPVQTWSLCVFGSEDIWQLGTAANPQNETTGSVDIQAMTNWLVQNGYISANPTVTALSMGWEICSTGGVPETFTNTGFTINTQAATQQNAPTVTTSTASSVSSATATLNGSVNPNGQATTYKFDYGTDTSYGTSVPSPDGSAGSGTTAVNENAPLTGLQPSTTYHYRLEATNATGTTLGSDRQFTTSAVAQQQAPTVTTNAATGVTSSGATLDGSVNPNGADTTYQFDYGTDTSYGSSVPVPASDIGSGTTALDETQGLTGLQPSTTYHYRVEATNSAGTTLGSDQVFTTSAVQQPPTVTTNAATSITSSAATLNGAVNPDGAATTYRFDYGTTTSYGSVIPAGGSSAGSGTTSVNETANVASLTPSTTYHYRVEATNSAGTTYGSDQAFTTSAASGGGTDMQYSSSGEYLNAWNNGPAVDEYNARSGNNIFKVIPNGSTGYVNISYDNGGTYQGSCIGDLGNSSSVSQTGLVNCDPANLGWGANFTQVTAGCPTGQVAFKNAHWNAYLAPSLPKGNGKPFILTNSTLTCFTPSSP